MNEQHAGDGIHALSGAYALDALSEHERAQFEAHLAGCSECAEEVASLREAAADLGALTAVEPPSSLRADVLAQIRNVRPLPPDVPVSAVPPSTSTVRRQPARRRWLAAVAAAVVLIGGGAVVAAWHPWDRSASQSQLTVADQVLQAPDAQHVEQTFPGGATATVVRSPSVGRAVVVTNDMPLAPDGKVYQLWLQAPSGSLTPAGLMPPAADQTVLLEGDASQSTGVGITVEPAGGSPQPTTKPIALISLA